jgi:hypothetical protein
LGFGGLCLPRRSRGAALLPIAAQSPPTRASKQMRTPAPPLRSSGVLVCARTGYAAVRTGARLPVRQSGVTVEGVECIVTDLDAAAWTSTAPSARTCLAAWIMESGVTAPTSTPNSTANVAAWTSRQAAGGLQRGQTIPPCRQCRYRAQTRDLDSDSPRREKSLLPRAHPSDQPSRACKSASRENHWADHRASSQAGSDDRSRRQRLPGTGRNLVYVWGVMVNRRVVGWIPVVHWPLHARSFSLECGAYTLAAPDLKQGKSSMSDRPHSV